MPTFFSLDSKASTEEELSRARADYESRAKKHEMQVAALTENLATVRSELKTATEKLVQLEQVRTEKAGKWIDMLLRISSHFDSAALRSGDAFECHRRGASSCVRTFTGKREQKREAGPRERSAESKDFRSGSRSQGNCTRISSSSSTTHSERKSITSSSIL